MDAAAQSAAQFAATWKQGCAAGHGPCQAVIQTVAQLVSGLGTALPRSGDAGTAAHAGVRALLTVLAGLPAVASCPSFPLAFGTDADVASLAARLLAALAVSAWDGDASSELRASLVIVLRHLRAHRPHMADGLAEGIIALAKDVHHIRLLQATGEASRKHVS
jgi:hypothetical protein